MVTAYSRLSLITLCVLLQGCAAGLGGDFACNKVGGISGCTDMNDIRTLADRGAFSNPTSVNTVLSHSTPKTDFMPIPRRDREGFPLRTSETVKKITIFPYINTDGHYVDTSDIYMVINESQWTGRAVESIQKD